MPERERFYLDHNATSPMLPEVLEAMRRFWSTPHGNPGSPHELGRASRSALHEARATVAAALGAREHEIVFTSGGTESLSAAIRGIVGARPHGAHLITCAVEHPAVLETVRELRDAGTDVTVLPVGKGGEVSVEKVLEATRPTTSLVTLMLANNEIGTIEPVREVAAALQARGIPVHTDAVQALGRMPVQVQDLGVAALSLSGHKFGGPPGSGVLYLREGVAFRPSLRGGKQEGGRRAGTENVAAAVGLAVAMRLAVENLERHRALTRAAVSAFVEELERAEVSFALNGPPLFSEVALPNTVNVAFHGVEAQTLLVHLDLAGVAASAGSACSSGSVEPSHVLQALGLSEEHVRASVRFSFGAEMDAACAARAAQRVAGVVKRIRS